MRPQLAIHESDHNGVRLLRLVGVLDGHTSSELEKKFQELARTGVLRLVVDLEGLSYIASAGVGLFINFHANAKGKGGSLHLLKPSATVRDVFNILGLSSLLKIHDNQEAALSAARA